MSPLDTMTSDEQTVARRRDGFALPVSIMVLALLTMGLVAGFALSTSEQTGMASHRAQACAFAARAGGSQPHDAQGHRAISAPADFSGRHSSQANCPVRVSKLAPRG